MGNLLYTKDFTNLALVSFTSEDPDRPAQRLLNRVRPNRRWYSTTTAAQTIIFSFSSSSLAFFALHHVNFIQVKLEHSTNGTTWLPFPPALGEYIIAKDKFDGYRKLFAELSVTGKIQVRMTIPSQATTDGAGGFHIGSVFQGASLTELSENPITPFPISPRRDYNRNDGKGKYTSSPQGDRRVEFSLSQTVLTDETSVQWMDIIHSGEETPYLFYLNRGRTEEMYYVQQNAEPSVTLNEGMLIEINIPLRQIV